MGALKRGEGWNPLTNYVLVKVVNASRDVFRTVFSIQNVFRTSRMALFTKIMNG